MNDELIAKIIVDSFKNEYMLDTYFNHKYKNKYMVFRPYIQSSNALLNYVFNLVISVTVLLSSLMLPLISFRLSRLRGDLSNRKAIFIPSLKAKEIFKSSINDTNSALISLLPGYGKDKYAFKLKYYRVYLRCLALFIKEFGRDVWFYRAILLIPEMIIFVFMLKKSKFESIDMTNHYDRWAYILSSYCKYAKCDLNLYQHGTIVGEFIPGIKLPVVSCLFAYNVQESDFFESNVIGVLHKKCILKPKLKLTNIEDSSSVLIIGSGLTEHDMLEKEVCSFFIKNSKRKAYIKPHPNFIGSRRYDEVDNERIEVITDKAFYPNVGTVVHFGSTLAIEYKSTNDLVKIIKVDRVSEIIELLEEL